MICTQWILWVSEHTTKIKKLDFKEEGYFKFDKTCQATTPESKRLLRPKVLPVLVQRYRLEKNSRWIYDFVYVCICVCMYTCISLQKCFPFSCRATELKEKNSQWAPTIAERGRQRKRKKEKEIAQAHSQILEKLHERLFFYWRESTGQFSWFVWLRACADGGLQHNASHYDTLQHVATHYCLGHTRRSIEPVQGDFIHSMQHVIEDENETPDFGLTLVPDGQGRFVVPFCRNLPCAPGINLIYAHSYRMVTSRRIPYLYRSFSAKEPYHECLICEKKWPTS